MASRTNVSRTKKPAPKGIFPKHAEPANDAPPKPAPEILPFDRGAVNEHAPLMTLVAAMFEAPNTSTKFKDPSAEFLQHVVLTLADETELIGATNDELDRTETVGRCSMRAEWRARIAVEIARRIQAGQVSP
jgi:hypothetical protein